MNFLLHAPPEFLHNRRIVFAGAVAKTFFTGKFFSAFNRESFISSMYNFADFDRCNTLPSRAGAGASVIGVVGAVVRVVVVVRACAAGMSEVR